MLNDLTGHGVDVMIRGGSSGGRSTRITRVGEGEASRGGRAGEGQYKEGHPWNEVGIGIGIGIAVFRKSTKGNGRYEHAQKS